VMPVAQSMSETLREPTFPQAMEIAAQWLGLWENGELSDEVLADRVAELVASRDGARGFFVVALAGDCPLMDRLPDPLALALRNAGAGVVDLSVRNLAMSSSRPAPSGSPCAAGSCCGCWIPQPCGIAWRSCWRPAAARGRMWPSWIAGATTRSSVRRSLGRCWLWPMADATPTALCRRQ